MPLSAFHGWEKIPQRIIVKEERLMDPKVDGAKVSFCGGWAPFVRLLQQSWVGVVEGNLCTLSTGCRDWGSRGHLETLLSLPELQPQ